MLTDALLDGEIFTKDEEAELNTARLTGDMVARERLILSCAPWAIMCATKCCKSYVYHLQELDYAISDAMIGLIHAVDKLEPEEGRLTTLVSISVKREIWLNRQSNTGAIRVPQCAQEGTAKRTAKMAELDKAARETLGTEYLNQWGSDTLDPAKLAETANDIQVSVEALSRLSKRDRKVVTMNVMCSYKLHEIGSLLCVTKERVRQIRNTAMKQLQDFVQERGQVDDRTP